MIVKRIASSNSGSSIFLPLELHSCPYKKKLQTITQQNIPIKMESADKITDNVFADSWIESSLTHYKQTTEHNLIVIYNLIYKLNKVKHLFRIFWNIKHFLQFIKSYTIYV